MNWFAIVIPNAIDTRYSQYGRPGVHTSDGWVARSDDRPGGWYMQTALKYAHRWKRMESAESAALIIGGWLPGLMGRMSVVEVRRIKNGWRTCGSTDTKADPVKG